MPLTPIAVKTYKATLTQSGTSAPTVVKEFKNTIGNIVWTRQTTGTYYGTLTGAFGPNTVPSGGFADADNNAVYGKMNYTTEGVYQLVAGGTNENEIIIFTQDPSTYALKEWSDIGGNITIEINVYN